MGPAGQVKICCISSPDEARIASEAGAELIGLVGPMPSGPGTLDLAAAGRIAASHRGTAKPVLLSASETAEAIRAEARRVGVTSVQAVRPLAPAEAERLARSGLTYLQVVHVEDRGALDLIEVYAPHCTAFLLDSGRPSAGLLGGTGAVHDWRISAEFVRRSPVPVFLAGGLDPRNVAAAIDAVRPFGLDICSGLRREGRLDPARLDAFMAAVDAMRSRGAFGPGRA